MYKRRVFWILLLCILIILTSILVVTYSRTSAYRWSSKLCKAIQQGDTNTALELVEVGISKGYSMDTLNKYPSYIWSALESTPRTPLQVSCECGNYLVAAQLLDAGATVYPAKGGIPTSPVFCVIRRHYLPDDQALIQLLIQHGATLEDDEYGQLIIDAAFRSPRDFSAEPDPVTGKYPYSEIVATGIADVFLLISAYRDCYAVNSANQNALHCAAAMGNWPLVEILTTQFDFPLDAEDIYGNTAYSLALESGASSKMLDLLIPQ